MQPYQEASQEIRRQGELPLKLAKGIGSAAATAGTALAGGSAAKKVLSLVNNFVPEDLAIKGLTKLDPRYGNFINKALGAGKSFDEVREFLSGKAEEGMEQENPKDDRNIIQKYSDNLHQYLTGLIQNGHTPSQAVSLIKKLAKQGKQSKRTMDEITQIEKDNQIDLETLAENIYGHTLKGNAQPSAQPVSNPNMLQGQGQGSGQQALMGILQKINQRLGQ